MTLPEPQRERAALAVAPLDVVVRVPVGAGEIDELVLVALAAAQEEGDAVVGAG